MHTKSIRLNKRLREDIANNIETAYISKNPAPTAKSREEINNYLKDKIKEVYLAKSKKIEDKAEKAGIPDWALDKTSYFYIYKNGEHHMTVTISSDENSERARATQSNCACDLAFTKDPVIKKAIAEHKQMLQDNKKDAELKVAWEKAKSLYMSDVNDVLNGVNTTLQLLDVWPAVESYLPVGVVNPSKINLPAISIDALNAKI